MKKMRPFDTRFFASTFFLSALTATLALVPASGLAMSKKATPAPPPAAVSPTGNPDTVWIGKSDGAQSCAKERGVDIDNAAGELQSAKIPVLAKKKVHDGKMRIQMCGVDKGDLNGFLIARKDLEKAKEMGFQPLTGTP